MEEDDSTWTAVSPREPTGCPPVEAITTLAQGSVVSTRIHEHVASCARCSAVVVQTRASEAALDGQLLAADTMVGRYQIVRRLGHGGMGVVYLAIDTDLDREVALKLVRRSANLSLDELTSRLRRESQLQVRANHPCVLAVHDIGRDGDRVYVAMELARGGTLRQWLTAAPRGWQAIVDVFLRAGEGLAAAHAAGLVHRDFKPDNVLLEHDKERVARVLVSDFGVARAVEAAERLSSGIAGDMVSTMPGALVGTLGYMAPEQLHDAAVDARADIFAFGVSVWEAVYGARPYPGRTIAELLVALDDPLRAPADRGGAPRWLERVLRRTLATDPARRLASMASVLVELDWRRRRRRRWAAAAAAVAAVATGAAIAMAQPSAVASPCDDVFASAMTLRAASAGVRTAAVGDLAPRRDLWADSLDRFAGTSERLGTEACGAVSLPGEVSNWQDRVRCIAARTEAAAALAVALARSPPPRVQLVIDTPPPDPPLECESDVAGALASRAPAPALDAAVADLELDIAAARGVALTDADEGVRQLTDLIARASALGLPTVVDEVSYARARMLRNGQTEAPLREVATAAERDGAPAIAAAAWLALAGDASSKDTKGMRELLAQADVVLDRAGNPPRLRALWYAVSAFSYATDANLAAMAKDIAAADQILASGLVPDPHLLDVLGTAEDRAGHASAALTRYEKAFAQIASTTRMDTTVISVRTNYASGLLGNDAADRAREVLEPVVAALDPGRRIGNDDVDAIPLMATLYLELNRYHDSEQLCARWQPALERDWPHDVVTKQLLYVRAAAALELNSYAEAEQVSARALERAIEIFGAESHESAEVRMVHGRALLELGRVAPAAQELERSITDLTATAGEDPLVVVQARIWLAEVRLREGKPGEAVSLLDASLEPYRKIQSDPGDFAGAELVLAEALVASHGDRARARTLVEYALAVWTSEPARWAKEIADATRLLAKLRR